MFQLLMKIPRDICVAVSGGPDSMAVVDFLKNNHNVTILHFNHATPHSGLAEEFVTNYAESNSLPLITGLLTKGRVKGESREEHWRNERYKFLERASGGKTVVLAHNLDDAVETWLFGSFHGIPKLIPPRRSNIIRPFLLVPKAELENWCKRSEIPFVNDPSNLNLNFARSRIRHNIMPEVLKVNPGIRKVIAKMYRKRYLRAEANGF